MTAHHALMGGKLHLYKRPNSDLWQCSTYLAGKNWRVSTKEDGLARAKDFAEDWYLGLKGKHRSGDLKVGKTFKQAAEKFKDEYGVITLGERSPRYVKLLTEKLDVHLVPFFGDKVLSEITPGLVQEYRVHRVKTSPKGKPPARSTIHHEIVALRQTLKTANRHGWIPYLPDLSQPYRSSSKVTHRAWFSPEEYKKLYEATRKRAKTPPKPRWKWACEELHDYVLFMANTGLRPDEAARLEFRDVAVVHDDATRETILEIEVRGKRGVGYCKSTAGAVLPFQRLKERRADAKETDRTFRIPHRELLNTILEEEGLKFDRDGNRRTAYSLRHTYICLHLTEGADIYQIAKNCRTSVEMIEKFYAAHIKDRLDAATINVRKPRQPLKKAAGKSSGKSVRTPSHRKQTHQ
jgi:integrase